MDDYIGDLDYLNDIRDTQLAPPNPRLRLWYMYVMPGPGLYYSPNNKDF